MNIELIRFEHGSGYTIGKLFIDGKYQCFTLEDVVRAGPKVAGKTAIPAGTYKVVIDYSNRFKKVMPHVLDVPGFEGIRIHSGNTSEDTEGCILLGTTWAGTDFIGNSRLAFDAFFTKLTKAIASNEEVSIIVR